MFLLNVFVKYFSVCLICNCYLIFRLKNKLVIQGSFWFWILMLNFLVLYMYKGVD